MRKKAIELKKHVATIHCSNTLTLLERKVSNALLYYAYPTLLAEAEHQISVKKLCELIGYVGKNHEAIKQAVRGLITTLLEWNIIDENGCDDWTASTILASLRLHKSMCIYAYSPRMKELLHSPTMYGRINMGIQAKFKSNYGLALYENCIRYRGLAQTKWFDFLVFRKLMGVEETKYQIFRDFNKRVLSKAVEEVNLHSDINVEPEIKRNGTGISEIRFKILAKINSDDEIFKNTKEQQGGQVENNYSMFKTQVIGGFGLTNEQFENIYKQYGEEYIKEKIGLITSSKPFKDGTISNLTGYFLSAIQNDYKQNISGEVVLLKKIKNRNKIEEKQKQMQKDQVAYQNYLTDTIEAFIVNLSSKESQNIKNQFESEVVPNEKLLETHFKKNGYNSGIVKGFFRNFIKEKFDLKLLSFSEWMSN